MGLLQEDQASDLQGKTLPGLTPSAWILDTIVFIFRDPFVATLYALPEAEITRHVTS